MSGPFLNQFWDPILEPLSELFWDPFWLQDRPRRLQEELKRANEGSKQRKSLFPKKWFSHRTVYIFSFLRPPETVPRGPERLPQSVPGEFPNLKGWLPKRTPEKANC